MNQQVKVGERGFIEIILLVILGLAALKYFFDFSIFEFLGSEEGKGVIYYIKEILVWIKEALVSLWNYIQ
jgi:hypothetical protein